eukprot:CAMPEP_0202940642 /NCGR_PEP_ID=MMETSP1395-20130829/781_1 /ASSEMBLY_ACC=CAM_ASM_000871 /TAXON_ID=5961 /ORGANISM="Blepharisma japonicum, Strain Stock R1072" /LENGTH=133 /DNA_ID=CAMNT_0049635243 /DNA_START=9 /DNA_END=407 /DNA_ORIENTATION=-
MSEAEDSKNIEQAITVLLGLERLFTEPEFICEIEIYLNNNLEKFESGEQTHECYEIYQKFGEDIEKKLQDFAREENLTEEEIFDFCKVVYEKDSNALTCFEYIFAACDYQQFLDMMLTRKELLDWREEEPTVE